MKVMQFQIGKLGLTEEVVKTLDFVLKSHDQVRISALKASGRDRNSIQSLADEIIRRLNYKCAVRVIGFKIILSKLSRVPKNKSKAL